MVVLLAILSGILGRMGGAGKHGHWYDAILDTKWRDIGCTLVFLFAVIWYFGYVSDFWWVYLLSGGLMFGSFTTYWDSLFGYDNLWFSGFIVGLTALPLLIIYPFLWWVVLLRTAFLCVTWGALNRWLPTKVFIWSRPVAEEFLRYAVSL